jgi:hypothetical protein
VNLSNLPTIAYAGELDPQKQASEVMAAAAAAEHVPLDRIVGRRIGHHFTPEAKQELDRRLDEILAKGRDPLPAHLRFTTWTTRYNQLDWLTVDALEHHWQQALVEGDRTADGFTLTTRNVTALSLRLPKGSKPILHVTIDGQGISTGLLNADDGLTRFFARTRGTWTLTTEQAQLGPLRYAKHHGLQGPIDDAFMDAFLIVRPTGRPLNDAVGRWAAAECDHAILHWFKQFRGHPRVKDDADVTDADLAANNVVCFGDPSSNRLLARLADKLPIHWTADAVKLGDRTFPADRHVPALIYPDPLNPARYVVLNSGFTYREYDYLNNARQTPKLPDYAVIDVSVPPTTQTPGRVVAAGFFDESWQLQPDDGRANVTVPNLTPVAP